MYQKGVGGYDAVSDAAEAEEGLSLTVGRRVRQGSDCDCGHRGHHEARLICRDVHSHDRL